MNNAFVVQQCRQLMAAQNLSLPQLAARLEIAQPYLGSILQGEKPATTRVLRDLASAFGQDPNAWQFQVEVIPQLEDIAAFYPTQWQHYLAEHRQNTMSSTTTAQAVPSGVSNSGR